MAKKTNKTRIGAQRITGGEKTGNEIIFNPGTAFIEPPYVAKDNAKAIGNTTAYNDSFVLPPVSLNKLSDSELNGIAGGAQGKSADPIEGITRGAYSAVNIIQQKI